MSNPAVAMQGMGMIFSAWGAIEAGNREAKAHERNAGFYREQAKFAGLTGQRQMEIHDSESKILYGQQLSAFAKNGVDTQNSTNFIAATALSQQREGFAIRQEMDMNVRLATLRAESAEESARGAREEGKWNALSSIFGGAANMAGG